MILETVNDKTYQITKEHRSNILYYYYNGINNNNKKIIYLFESNGFYKIGITNDIKKRLSNYKTHNPNEIKLIEYAVVYDAREIEIKLHDKYKSKRLKGEWFSLDDDDVYDIIIYFNRLNLPCWRIDEHIENQINKLSKSLKTKDHYEISWIKNKSKEIIKGIYKSKYYKILSQFDFYIDKFNFYKYRFNIDIWDGYESKINLQIDPNDHLIWTTDERELAIKVKYHNELIPMLIFLFDMYHYKSHFYSLSKPLYKSSNIDKIYEKYWKYK